MNIFYTTENNSVKKQLPRTHLTLSLSRTRSLLSPPLCHKWVSVWTWTLNWNKHKSFIKTYFTGLNGLNKATEKDQVTLQSGFIVEVSRQDHKYTKPWKIFVSQYLNPGRTLSKPQALQVFRSLGSKSFRQNWCHSTYLYLTTFWWKNSVKAFAVWQREQIG